MFDYVSQLRKALDDSHLENLRAEGSWDEGACDAAFMVAVAWGRCRLASQPLSDDLKRPLDPLLAGAAADHGHWLVGQLEALFHALIEPEKVSDDPLPDQDTRCGILRSRHELWAASIAIGEADDALAAAGCPLAGLTDKRTELILKTADLDFLFITHVDEFAPVTQLPLLPNLKQSIANTMFRDELPWWLDGTIEKAAETARRHFLAWLPEPRLIEQAITNTATPASVTRLGTRGGNRSGTVVPAFWKLRFPDARFEHKLAADSGAVPEAVSRCFLRDCTCKLHNDVDIAVTIQVKTPWHVEILVCSKGPVVASVSAIWFGSRQAVLNDPALPFHWTVKLEPPSHHDVLMQWLTALLAEPVRIEFADGQLVMIDGGTPNEQLPDNIE